MNEAQQKALEKLVALVEQGKTPAQCHEVLMEARAALSHPVQQPGAVPSGWRLVPEEPTPEMIAAWPNNRHGSGHEAAIYRAMLAAAQPPASQPVQQDSDLRDTIAAMLDAVGYPDEYALSWPKEKASVTFKRWFDEQLAKAAGEVQQEPCREALAELLAAEEAKFPLAEEGSVAHTAWSERRAAAREAARAVLAGKGVSAKPAEPQTGDWIAAEDYRRNVRAMDVALNGEDGAAQQAALTDLLCQVEAEVRRIGHPLLKRVPFRPETWPVDADGFEANLCTECGTPTRYGSRHSKCGEKVMAAEKARAAAEVRQPLSPFTPAQRRRLWDNSPEHHADAKSMAGFERIVTLTERAHGILPSAQSGEASNG